MDNYYKIIGQDINLLRSHKTQLPADLAPNGAAVVIIYAADHAAQITHGKDVYSLKKGECMILDASQPIDLGLSSSEPVCFVLSGALVKKHYDQIECFKAKLLMETGMLGAALKQIEAYQDTWTPDFSIKQAFNLLLALITQPASTELKPRLVLEACALMDREYAHIYGVEDVADRLGVTKAHLIRVFKTAWEITPGQYLKQIRMQHAKRFLANRELSLDVVAGLAGYANANYLGKVFKKTYGLSPKAYRQMAIEQIPEKDSELPDEAFL